MAAVVRLSTLLPVPGKGISATNLDTQFQTGTLASTTLTAFRDVLSTTLDAPVGAALGYQAVGFNVLNNQTLDTAAGDDTLDVAQGAALNAVGIKVGTGGLLNTGLGGDKISIVLTGVGSVGVSNQGRFLTGAGIDIVAIDAVLNGFVNGSATNRTAVFDAGAGLDKMSATSLTGHAIVNYGTITMGLNTENEKDSITGGSAGHLGLTPSYTPGRFGIFNAGTINMGGGKDVVDGLVGGFGGGGVVNLGDGDDSVAGFGSGTFNGGAGRNSISLPAGSYKITYTVKPLTATDPGSGTLIRNGDLTTVMTFNQFDSIGGSGLNGALHITNAPAVGALQTLSTFTVNAAGDISALTYL